MKITFDFEKPLAELQQQIEKVKQVEEKNKLDMTATVLELEAKLETAKKEIYSNLTGWQKVQISRHPERPYTLQYLELMCDDFIELHGDRTVGDDKAIIGGFGTMNGQTAMFIGHQKGRNTKERQYRNFGMANPEGYRKALRLMKMAEKFNKPVITLIDTPGAFPGLEAEERGQGEAIARNLIEMSRLRVPTIATITGEGGSGGALALAVADRVLMLENAIYSVISPEGCASIMWKDASKKQQAAAALKYTAGDVKLLGCVDDVLREPRGGTQNDPAAAMEMVGEKLKHHLDCLRALPLDVMLEQRYTKFRNIAQFYTTA